MGQFLRHKLSGSEIFVDSSFPSAPMALQIRRRELRCCLILVFVFVAVASTWVYATDTLDMDMSLPNIEAPEWLRVRPKPIALEETKYEEDVQESNTQSDPTATISPTILKPANHLAQVSSQNNVIETTIPRGAYIQGFTVLDNLYMKNGTFFIVTSDAASKFPLRSSMISKPLIKSAGVDIEPTDQVCAQSLFRSFSSSRLTCGFLISFRIYNFYILLVQRKFWKLESAPFGSTVCQLSSMILLRR